MAHHVSPPPTISLTRTIHPVGQGAFYSELFANEHINVPLLTTVYDCGGFSNKQLKQEADTIKQLGLVFVSHFHNDHTNGLKYLIDNNPNACVILPAISHCRFIVDLIYNYLSTGSKSCSSILFMLSVIPFLSEKQPNNGVLEIDLGPTEGSKTRIKVHTIASGIPFHIRTPFRWIYDAFYNEGDISKEKELITRLSALIPSLGAVSLDKDVYFDSSWYENHLLPEITTIESRLSEVKKIYSEVFDGSHNSYSMVVHSHSENNVVENADCLFTGDAEKSPSNETLFRKLLPHPHYIQVPHHGSDKNHNPHYYFRRQIAFMSVGYHNSFHHPGGQTVMDLTRICPYIHIITEDSKTRFKKKFPLF